MFCGCTSPHRYGFNGQEKDDEVKGSGNSINYKARIYDPRLGRFLSIDPLTKKFAWLTPYQFASNTPIQGIDLDGLELFYTADGSLIGKIGDNTQVRLVNNNDVKTVQGYITWANNTKSEKYQAHATEKAKQFSCDVGITGEEMNTRAFLGTLTKMEGAAYDKKIGGSKFEGNKHPGGRYLYLRGVKTYLSPAGAYQFTEETAKEFSKKAGVDDFSPESQDAMAVELLKEKKALPDIKAGDIDAAFKKIKGRWSSVPGGSEENKNVDADKTFKENVSKELQNNSPVATPQGKLDVE